MTSQGTKANKNGNLIEKQCELAFRSCGIEIIAFKQVELLKKQNLLPSIYIVRNAPFTSIYGHRGKTEFVLVDNRCEPEKRIRIECKFQKAKGSVDEKIPYIYENIIEGAYPEKNVIVLLAGNGYRAGTKKWFKKKIIEYSKTPNCKNVTVMENTDELTSWIMNTYS